VVARRRRPRWTRVLIDGVTSAAAAHATPDPSPRFCSRCGARSHERWRVCDRCEMGVLLTCRGGELPGEAFLICTHELRVTAVSEAGEGLLAGADVVGSHLLDLATCPLGDDQLARHVALAAQRQREPVVVPVRLRSSSAAIGTLAARIATCGPPRAAVVTLQQTGFGRR
jgi:hypothetical protein